MIRKFLLRYLITGVSVGLVLYFIPGITYSGGITKLLEIISVFFVASLVLKPILKVLAFPIELATLGLFSIVINAFVFWLVSVWVEELMIASFWFPGWHGAVFVIAPVEIPVWLTAIVGSFLIGAISTVLYWLTK